MRRKIPIYVWYLLPFCVIVFLVVLAPLIYSLYISFFRYNLSQLYLGMKFVGLSNYLKALADPDVLAATKISLAYVVFTISGELVLGFVLALILNRKLRGRAIFRVVVLLPMMLTPAAVGLVWRYFYTYTGLVNYTLELLGLKAVDWFTAKNAFLSIIIVTIWQNYPFSFLVLLAGLQTIPDSVREAAQIDGASSVKMFMNITLPLVRPFIMVILVIRTIYLLRSVDLIITLTSGGPGRATETFSYLIYTVGFEFFNMGYASALSYLLIILSLTITWGYVQFMRAE